MKVTVINKCFEKLFRGVPVTEPACFDHLDGDLLHPGSSEFLFHLVLFELLLIVVLHRVFCKEVLVEIGRLILDMMFSFGHLREQNLGVGHLVRLLKPYAQVIIEEGVTDQFIELVQQRVESQVQW